MFGSLAHRGGAILAVAVVVCSGAFLTPGVAGAASLSFTVNSTADTHDAHAGDGICADATKHCTLRAAIEETNARPAGTTVTVTVHGGTFKLSLGTLAMTHNTLTVNGAGPANTIVQQDGTTGVVSVSAGVHVTLSGLELTGGGASSQGGGLYNSGTTALVNASVTGNSANAGAGVTNRLGAGLLLWASTVSNNTVVQPGDSVPGGAGGGILNAGTVWLIASTISGNDAGAGGLGQSNPGGNGGNGGGIFNTGTVATLASKITGNSAGSGGPGRNDVPGNGGSGGGIYSSAGTVSLSSTTVGGNASGSSGAELTGDGPANAGNGGGVYNGANLAVTGSTFAFNNAGHASGLGGEGGAIYNAGTATISTSTLARNAAGTGGQPGGGNGGAVANIGTLTVTDSTLSYNTAATGESGVPGLPGGNGGAISQAGGNATLARDTLNNNSSGNGGPGAFCDACFGFGGPGGRGGAIYATANVNLTNTTVSDNTVGLGGANAPPLGGSGAPGIGAGLDVAGGTTTVEYATVADNSDGIVNDGGTVTLGGTIVADSTGANDQTANNCTGAITETSGFNLDSGTTCNFAAATDINGQEPLVAPLAANGGPTATQALEPGSPAIDHGGTSADGCPATDQRGVARPDETPDNGCDIGAYDSQGVA